MRCTLLPFLMMLLHALQAQEISPSSDTGLQAKLNEYTQFDRTWFPEPKDSAEFFHFRNGLKMTAPSSATDTTTIHYRMVWREVLRGGFGTVTRGDGQALEHRARAAILLYDQTTYLFTTADGRRGVVMIFEEPCGLVCRSVLYYVEE